MSHINRLGMSALGAALASPLGAERRKPSELELWFLNSVTKNGDAYAKELAIWNGVDWLAAPAPALGGSPTTPLSGGSPLAIHTSSEAVYIGGDFSGCDGSSANKIAKWDGTQWSTFSNGVTGAYSYVFAIMEFEGDLIIGGRFTTVGGVTCNNVARWNGSAWVAMGCLRNISAGDAGQVESFVEWEGELYACGDFETITGADADFFAKWNGSTWDTVGAGLGNNAWVLKVFQDKIVIGGYFASTALNVWNGSSFSDPGDTLVYVCQGALALNTAGTELLAGSTGATVESWDGSTWSAFPNFSGALYGAAFWRGSWYVTGILGSPYEGVARWNGSSWVNVDNVAGEYGVFSHGVSCRDTIRGFNPPT